MTKSLPSQRPAFLFIYHHIHLCNTPIFCQWSCGLLNAASLVEVLLEASVLRSCSKPGMNPLYIYFNENWYLSQNDTW